MTRSRTRLRRKRLLPREPRSRRFRKSAKKLLRALHAGEESALARFEASRPAFDNAESMALHDAQWVLAREYGFESWTKLIHHVEHIEWIQGKVNDLAPEELIEQLANRDWRIFHTAESHLFQNLDTIMDAVLVGIEHENPRIRAACALLMDHGGDDRCIEPLRKALNDPAAKVRLTALHSLQCQRCKDEPLRYDPIPDMIRMAATDPDPKVRRGALGGMGIQPSNRLLAAAVERAIEREPDLHDGKGAAKLLRHHLYACTLEELLERVERDGPTRIRQAAAVNLPRHEPSADAATRLEALVAVEENEILRRCLERGWRHHAGG